MSVPVHKRCENKLEVIVQARELAYYTLKILKNENNFDPAFRFSMRQDLEWYAKAIHADVFRANDILVKTREDAERRSKLQRTAAENCNLFLASLDLAQRVYHSDGDRMENWTKQIVNVRSLIRKWAASDAERFKEIP